MDEKLSRVVSEILKRLNVQYGATFTRHYAGIPLDELIKVWGDDLKDLSVSELRMGYASLKDWGKAFPPSLPEFRKLCRPDINFDDAYAEAVRGWELRRVGRDYQWSHPAIYHASKGMVSDLLTKTYKSIEPHWRKALMAEFAKGQWEPVPPVPKQLPVTPKPKDRTVGNNGLARIRALLA